VQASADDCCLIILDLLKSIAQMNHSDAFHNSASPQESSGSLLPLLAHSSAPKSPGPLAIQLHAIDSSIQTGPTDIPQGELHSLAAATSATPGHAFSVPHPSVLLAHSCLGAGFLAIKHMPKMLDFSHKTHVSDAWLFRCRWQMPSGILGA